MTALKIILSIILFFLLILFIRVKFVITCQGNDVKLILKIFGIPFRLFEKSQKEKKIKLSDYSYKAMLKREKKNKKTAKKKAEYPAEKDSTNKNERPSASDTISLVTSLLRSLVSRLFKHLRVDITRIYITVGAGDAAKTAILYGVISQAAAVLLEVLGKITNVKRNSSSYVNVVADFTAEKTDFDINLGLSLRLWQAVSIGIGALVSYIKEMFKRNK